MSTTQTQSAQAPTALVAANMFTAAGGGLHVSYSTNGIDGKPHLSYQDPCDHSALRATKYVAWKAISAQWSA